WIQRKEFSGSRKPPREIKIICIKKRNVLKPAFQNAQVPAGARTAIGPVWMAVKANGRVLFGQFHAHREAAIWRAIFHQHDLGRFWLGEGRLHRFADKRLCVVNGDYNADLHNAFGLRNSEMVFNYAKSSGAI